MRLWIDDVRPMPDDYDVHARTAGEAMSIIDQSPVDHVGFDHDLGDFDLDGRELTGYTVATHIERRAFLGMKPPTWTIQSSNPEGRRKIDAAMQNSHRLWNQARLP